MSIEEPYRAWHHHWTVCVAVVGWPTEAMVARLMGMVGLADTVQMPLGQRVSPAPVGQQRRAPWTGSDRVRWFWGGQRLWSDSGDAGSCWLGQQWERLRLPAAVALASPMFELALTEAA